MTLKRRIEKLEERTKPERPAVIVARDVIWDVVTSQPFESDLKTAIVISHLNIDILDMLCWHG